MIGAYFFKRFAVNNVTTTSNIYLMNYITALLIWVFEFSVALVKCYKEY